MATAKKVVKKVVKVAASTKTAPKNVAAPAKKATTKTDGKALSPLEKARLARANGTAKPKAKTKRKPIPVFKAPEEFKPFFLKALVQIDKDGIITDMKATRIKGSPTNPNAKTVDMGLHDPDTLRRIAVRFAGPAFIRSDAKRLPGKSAAQLLMRVGANRETGAIRVGIKEIRFKAFDAKKPVLLDKKDPRYRALRKPVRLMPAAFTKTKPFPTAADLKALLKSVEE